MKTALYVLFGLGFVGGIAPVAAMIWASWFARRHGCDLNEGTAQPCIVNGIDWGDTLYACFVMGWFGMIGLPIALVSAIGLVVLLVRGFLP